MQNRNLIIDCQVFQSAAWDRGMGKYSLNLLKGLAKNKRFNYKKTYLIFSTNLPFPVSVKKEIKRILPNARLLMINIPAPSDVRGNQYMDLLPIAKNNITKRLRGVIGENLSESDFLILSLFIDQACSIFPGETRNILLFYDLIPFQYHERYGKLTSFINYLSRFRTLFSIDLVLTISQTVADDLCIYLGIPKEKVFSIDGAAIERNLKSSEKPKFTIPSKYVLMPSGNDLRKNNVIAVQSFEEYLRIYNDKDTKLIITSFFDEITQTNLRGYSPNIIFSGNVSEDELVWLYKNAEAVLFVPEYEGLGLPILEGVEAEKPIVCSNLTAFNEMSRSAFYYADEHDTISISKALKSALIRYDFNKKKRKYKNILKTYSWDETANKTIDALEHIAKPTVVKKKKIAIMAPDPSGYSDIGKRVMQLHYAMSEYFDIDYYLESGISNNPFHRPSYLPYVANAFKASELTVKNYKNYDAVLYNIGNSEYHVETIKKALSIPGYAVFHDLQLKNLFTEVLGELGILSKDRVHAENVLNKKSKTRSTSYLASLTNMQKGIIVHSDYAKQAVNELLIAEKPISKINLPTATPKLTYHRLRGQPITIGLAGIIHPAKGLDIIESIAKTDAFSGCDIHIFGLSLVEPKVLQQLEAYPNVTIDSDVTDFQFQTMLSKVDILINFRKEYRGETSGATIEAMRFGVVPIVRRIGWFDELPDSCVVKAESVNELIEQLDNLIGDPKKLKNMKDSARLLIENQYSYADYARRLYDLMRVV